MERLEAGQLKKCVVKVRVRSEKLIIVSNQLYAFAEAGQAQGVNRESGDWQVPDGLDVEGWWGRFNCM